MNQSGAQTIHDCWNRIGVRGDQSCPKLAGHIHCRNCEVYAEAAQLNLQRPLDPDYQREWASHTRRVDTAAGAGACDSSLLAFRIGREWLALPTAMLLSAAPLAKAHTLPHRTGHGLAGVVNVGGKLYPCMALAALLGIDEQAQVAPRRRHVFARLLLIEWQGQAYALPVAELHGIVRYAASTLAQPAATINKGLARFLAGVLAHEEMHIGFLDAGLLGQQLAKALR